MANSYNVKFEVDAGLLEQKGVLYCKQTPNLGYSRKKHAFKVM